MLKNPGSKISKISFDKNMNRIASVQRRQEIYTTWSLSKISFILKNITCNNAENRKVGTRLLQIFYQT